MCGLSSFFPLGRFNNGNRSTAARLRSKWPRGKSQTQRDVPGMRLLGMFSCTSTQNIFVEKWMSGLEENYTENHRLYKKRGGAFPVLPLLYGLKDPCTCFLRWKILPKSPSGVQFIVSYYYYLIHRKKKGKYRKGQTTIPRIQGGEIWLLWAIL